MIVQYTVWGNEALRERVAELEKVLEELFQTYMDQCAMKPDPPLCSKVRAILFPTKPKGS